MFTEQSWEKRVKDVWMGGRCNTHYKDRNKCKVFLGKSEEGTPHGKYCEKMG
jgi:hypothetical protein